jgi:dihydrofolate reductase
MFKITTCINKKGAIGNKGKLLYSIMEDLINFKTMTIGNVVIMGRKTFESLPGGKPLSDRINIVLTHDAEWGVEPADNLFIANSLEDAVGLCEAYFADKELFVIGGESIYKQFLDAGLVDEIRFTIVDDFKDGDTHFPEYDASEWRVYYESLKQTSRDNISFIFQILKKI